MVGKPHIVPQGGHGILQGGGLDELPLPEACEEALVCDADRHLWQVARSTVEAGLCVAVNARRQRPRSCAATVVQGF